MERDRKILWGWIILLALVIVAQFVANRLAAHSRGMYSHPDPKAVKMLAP